MISLGDKLWSVRNYENAYLGAVTLAEATTHSDNAVCAELTHLVGPKAVATTARRLGIRSQLDPYFAIGLGAEAVNRSVARACAAFRLAASGSTARSSGTDRASRGASSCGFAEGTEDRFVRGGCCGGQHDLGQPDAAGRRAQERAAAPFADRPVAGKTGTTENYGDAWFVGYTPQLVTAVWVGYPKTRCARWRPSSTVTRSRAGRSRR